MQVNQTFQNNINELINDTDVDKFYIKGGLGIAIFKVTTKSMGGYTKVLAVTPEGQSLLKRIRDSVNDKTDRASIIKDLSKADFTQSDIAYILSISQASVSNYLKDK